MLENNHDLFKIDARKRMFVLGGGLLGVFSLLGGRLFQLQVMQGGEYRNLAEDNRISLQPVLGQRGRIFDRFNRILVENIPDFRLAIIPELAGDLRELFERLQPFLVLTEEEVELFLKQASRQRAFLPLQVKAHLSWQQVSEIESRIYSLPGVVLNVRSTRFYPHSDSSAHLLGYLGEVNEMDRKSFSAVRFRSGDLIGKTGIERQFEDSLRGKEGVREMEVNALGRQIRELKRIPARPGRDLHLTVDIDLQREAEKSLTDLSGAIVVLDPNSGGVLAMASQPSFDPNWFIHGFAKDGWKRLVTDPNRPLINKAIQGQYPPGSTFKIASCMAALSEGKISGSDWFYCGGYITIESHKFYCWRHQGHGQVGIVQALAQSCDVFFYRLAERVGIDAIERQARLLGLGDLTQIGLVGERPGLVPSRAWKRAVYSASWFPGETLITAIGQGYLLTTPLQLASMMAAVANGGTVHRPTLVRSPGTPPLQKNHWKPEHLALLRRGLEAVVHGETGTARKCAPEKVRAAGKTGTSQVVRHRRDERGKIIKTTNASHLDHALFVGYAPVDNPKIALAVVVEHGGHGSTAAAPIAKRIIDFYFANPSNELIKPALRS